MNNTSAAAVKPPRPQAHDGYITPQDGPLMRRYLRWASQYYDQFAPERRQEMAAVDRWLYSRRALGFHLGWLGSCLGIFFGLRAASNNTALAMVLTVVVFLSVGVAAVFSWFDAKDFAFDAKNYPKHKSPWLRVMHIFISGYVGALFGFSMMLLVDAWPAVDVSTVIAALAEAFQKLTPYTMALFGVVLGVTGVTLWIKKQRLEHQLVQLHTHTQVQAQTAAVTQAQLKVLQAQIQPHFLFNTLAAAQHWVDTQDPRASALLRDLTSFLRRSTDALEHDMVPLEQELKLVEDYLRIMQHRLGKKLNFQVRATPACAALTLPPAVLLSLVENAVEHGIEPALSGGSIDVRTDAAADGSWRILVQDTGVGLNDAPNKGVGLSNTKKRLAAHFGERAKLTLSQATNGPGALALIEISPASAATGVSA